MERRSCYRILNVRDEIYASGRNALNKKKEREREDKSSHAPPALFSRTRNRFSRRAVTRRAAAAESVPPIRQSRSAARVRRGFANYHERLNINAKSGRRPVGRARHTMRRKVDSREHETLAYRKCAHIDRKQRRWRHW